MRTPLNLERDQQLQQQIFDQLRALIQSGQFAPGARMPSTRMLAEQFSISRTTAVLAYERLAAEGYLDARPARGTFVAFNLPSAAPHLVVASTKPELGDQHEPCGFGAPDPLLFPMRRWRTLMRTALDGMGAIPAHPDCAGDLALRAEIAAWLSTSRGIAVTPEQVIVTNDRAQALHMVAHLALRPGARVVVEDPSSPADSAPYSAEWADLVRVAVDSEGICTGKLPTGRAALVHVSPEHQRPLGARMSLARRTALLAWAARADALVLEDDTQGELHYGEKCTPTLFSLDRAQRVILLGGFCASLGPWVRLAYLVVPAHRVDEAIATRHMVGDVSAQLQQMALHEFLSSGAYARHLYRVAKTYAARRNVLVSAVRRHFPQQHRVWGEQAGLHVTWHSEGCGLGARQVAALARHCGLDAMALPGTAVREGGPVMLGLGATAEHLIEAKVARLANLVSRPTTTLMAAD